MTQTCTGPLKAFCARFSITTTTTGILAMGSERKTRSGSQIPGISNGFRYFLASSQSAQKGEMTDNRPFHGQRKSSRPSPALSDITRCWVSRLVDMPTATSDSVKVTGLSERLVETAKAFPSEYRSELLCAYQRPARGQLSTGKLTQHHGMVEPSLDP